MSNSKRPGRERHEGAGGQSQRDMLLGGGALAGITAGFSNGPILAASPEAANAPPSVPEWMKTPGDPVGSQLYGSPSSFEKEVVRNVTKNAKQ